MQFDADTVGAASMAADAEMCMLAADTMEALGIPRGQYVVKVNNRKILDGAMDALQIPAEKRLTTMRAIDKLDRLGVDGVRMLLGKGRKDESGDFTKGAELDRHCKSRALFAIISGKGAASCRQAPAIRSFQKSRHLCALLVTMIACGSIKPSCAASNTTPARSTKLN